MQAPHGFGQSPFFYYNPHPKPEHRQHGHFSPHPRGSTSNMMQDQRSPRNLYSSAIGHARPTSCDPQSRLRSQSPYAGTLLSSLTLATPRPLCQKPTILVNDDVTHSMTLQTARSTPDAYLFPATPPLSVSASAIGSPLSSCGMVSTPGDATSLFFGHDQFEDMKVKSDPELQHPMTLAGGDWSWNRSPPLTPVFIHPHSATANQTSELLSVQSSCPSLSPSPSPLPSSASRSSTTTTTRGNLNNNNHRHQQHLTPSKVEFNYCDPRNLDLTQGLSVTYPLLPTLCAGDDEEHKLILGEEPIISSKGTLVNDLACFGASTVHGLLPPFDELSELDSEEDLVGNFSKFVPTDNIHFIGSKRQRTEIVPFENESFTSDTDSDAFDCGNGSTFSIPSPSGSETSRRGSDDSSFALSADGNVHSLGPRKILYDTDHSETESFIMAPYSTRSATAYQAANSAGAGQQQQQGSSSGRQQSSSGEQSNSGSSDGASAAQPPAPVSRRGRKQSLTEDPSKTFVCDLCSRRFRRQEHLKRHYRSLHTQEKPFECNECGKKFSRSDNLAQHARTHGSGAIVMGVLEGGQMLGGSRSDSYDEDEINILGAALFEAAHAAAGSTSNSSDEASSGRDSLSPPPSEDSSPRKKRKRTH
ncbi:MAG: hypothetical protein M1816_002998 [Peltula sp. TS41687]|nr:MAG: hypothetical protein M1816_002998 [Peltula sp. TS41687]